MSPLGVEEVVS